MQEQDPAHPDVQALPPEAAASPTDAVIPEVAAVIAAAVSVVLGDRARIHHILMSRGDEQAGWTRMGRINIMRSHDTGSGRG